MPTSKSTWSGQRLVEQMGPHPSTRLGLDLDSDAGRAAWLVAALLLSGRGGEERALKAYGRLAAAGLEEPGALAAASPAGLVALLDEAGLPQAERVGARLQRAARGLLEQHGGSLGRLAAEGEGLEGLGAGVMALAPGVGPATAARFLRPFRAQWPAAAELPLDPAARAAAVHLGWLAGGDDTGGDPAGLLAWHQRQPDPPALADLEAALERLGRQACRAGRRARCPLGPACPA